jgi:hypothetical protein
MMFSVTGTYKDGQLHLDEVPPGIAEAEVIVIFLPDSFWEKQPGLKGPVRSEQKDVEKQ